MIETKLKLGEGKTYILRNGTIPKDGEGNFCKLRRIPSEPIYKWCYGNETYTDKGTVFAGGINDRDIVAECVPTTEEKPEAPAETKTLLDEFAMAALQGLLACPDGEGNLAIDAYYWADKMLVERAKGKAQS